MKSTAEGHTTCTENSGRTQLHNLDKGNQAHASRLEDAFYAVIYTARAPGKVSTRLLLLSFSSHENFLVGNG